VIEVTRVLSPKNVASIWHYMIRTFVLFRSFCVCCLTWRCCSIDSGYYWAETSAKRYGTRQAIKTFECCAYR